MTEQTPEPTEIPDDEAGHGPAVPDEPSAEAAQEGVQTAFSVDP
jgi:hypothetical protein